MSAPVVMMACKCGAIWDTHGRYSSCPCCAEHISNSRPATEQEIANARVSS